ncbi:MAG: hypothetical protein E7458_03100 [Ruminococcaceae bacterium]|nr:hypothetical protein [Oscillospiraceae bacterium]
MTKNDNAHALRFADSLSKYAGAEAAAQFAEAHPLSKSATVDKKFQWAAEVCQYLDENFDPKTRQDIRKPCRCNDGKSIARKLSTYWKRADSVQAFVDAFNAKESFASLEYISENKILFCYPECYCACVKRVGQQLPMTWCYCTVGNAEGIFRELLQKDVTITLRESIKSGGERCAMEVEW